MAVEIDTATDHTDLYNKLREFLERGITTPGGPDWELLREDLINNRALYRAPGLTSTEDIYIGISLHESVATDTFAIGLWMFRDFNPGLGDLEQPGTNTVVYLPVWNDDMSYWFVANGQRLIVVAKVSTTYQSMYAGKFLPWGTPGEYPQPFYYGAPVGASTTRWSTINEGNRNFWDPGDNAYMLMPGAGSWRHVQNFDEVGSSETAVSGSNYVWPFCAQSLDSTLRDNYRELRENVDGTYPLWPLTLCGTDPDRDIWGDLDGVFAVSGFNNASENTITVGGDTYLVVQNMFRTARYYYVAILLE